jgi:hypothetical protein
MTRHQSRREGGAALLIAMLMMALMGLIGFAALSAVTQDARVAGAIYRKKLSFYAAEAGIAKTLETMRTTGAPTVPGVSLADTTAYPHGQPTYSLDTVAADPVESLGFGGFPGMNLQIGQNGGPTFQMQMYRVRVQGTSPGGGLTRLETVSGVLVTN